MDLGIGLVVGALILGLAGPLSDLLGSGEADASLVRVAVLIAFAQTVDGTTGAVLLLAGRRELRAWVVFGTSVLRLVGVLWAVGVGGPQEVLVAYAAAAFAGALIQGGLAWRVGWSKWDRAGPQEGAREWLGKLRSFGIFSSVSSSVQGAQRSAVPVILGSLAGAGTVGIFTVALFPLTVASLSPPRHCGSCCFPNRPARRPKAMSTVFAGPSRAQRGSGWRSVCLQRLPDGSCCPSSCRLSTPVSSRTRSRPARILLLAAVVHLALAWAKTFLPAIGRPGLQTAYEVAFAVLLISGIALLARFEATGAAIAVSLTYVATQVPLYFVANRLLDDAERLPPEDRSSGLASRNPGCRLPMTAPTPRLRAKLHHIARAA